MKKVEKAARISRAYRWTDADYKMIQQCQKLSGHISEVAMLRQALREFQKTLLMAKRGTEGRKSA